MVLYYKRNNDMIYKWSHFKDQSCFHETEQMENALQWASTRLHTVRKVRARVREHIIYGRRRLTSLRN